MARGEEIMEDLILEELTEEKATYRYFPLGSSEYGVVAIMRKTGECFHEKKWSGSTTSIYARQAWQRLREYQKSNKFPEKDLVAWY